MSKDFLSSIVKKLLLTILKGATKTEKLRITLFETPEFSYNSLVSRIDHSNQGLLTSNDISLFLKENSIKVNPSIINMFTTYYCGDESSQLDSAEFITYEDMISFLYPKTLIKSRETNADSSFTSHVSFDLEQIASQILVNELRLINEIAKCLDEFYQDDTFVIYDILRLLNQGEDSKYINEDSIEAFCYNYNINLSHNELRIIFDRLDRNGDRKISYNELKLLFRTHVSLKDNEDIIVIAGLNNNNKNDFAISHSDKASTQISNYLTQIDLTKFLLDLMKYETILQNAKSKLYLNEEIVPIELFYLFDCNNENGITKSGFRQTLNTFCRLSPTALEINLLFHHYSPNNEDMLTYDEFKRMIIPNISLALKERMISFNSEPISEKTKNEIKNHFQVLLTIESKIEKIRHQFTNSKSFSAYEQFLFLKNGHKNLSKIDKSQLNIFLLGNSNNVLLDNIDLLYHRMDINGDYLIGYDDFLYSITPLSFY